MAMLFLMVGLPGAGKSTRARALAAAHAAVRLSPDAWMAPLFGAPDVDGKRDVLEGRLIWTATQVLRAGADAILDFGFWGRDERAALHWLAGTLGATARTIYLPIDRATQAERVFARWRDTPERTWPIGQDALDAWREMFQEPEARELAGPFVIDPPEGFAGWGDWIAARWPTAWEAD